jgi:uncharacterized protein (TIGR02147 family)
LKRKQKNKKYSLRAFAKKIEVSHSVISEILNGKRRITTKTFSQISKKLNLDQAISKKYESYIIKRKKQYTQIETRAGKLMSEWYFNALLELLEIKNVPQDPKSIADQLNIEESKVMSALNLLQELGLITRRNNKWKVLIKNTTSWGNLNYVDIVNRVQMQNLEKGKKAIEEIDINDRSSIGLTVAMNPEDLPEARKLIYDSVSRIGTFLERKGSIKKQVFHLNVMLFPLSKKIE